LLLATDDVAVFNALLTPLQMAAICARPRLADLATLADRLTARGVVFLADAGDFSDWYTADAQV
jgi:hypothetical protein